jgi:hypothetical protein
MKSRQVGRRNREIEKKLLTTQFLVQRFAANALCKYYFNAAMLAAAKRGFELPMVAEGLCFLSGKSEKVPAALQVFERRQYRPFLRGETLATISEINKGVAEISEDLAVFAFPGPKDEGITAIYFHACGARACRPSMDLKSFAASVAKIVFE